MIDLTPLAQDGIQLAAATLSLLVPVAVGYGALWLRNHGILKSAQAQGQLQENVNQMFQKAINYGASDLKAVATAKPLLFNISDPTVAAATSYAVAQAPDLLKKAGYDVTTEAGQKAIARMVVARIPAVPPPVAPAAK